MENWKRETERYLPRIEQLVHPLDDIRDTLVKLPSAPLSFRLTNLGIVGYQLCTLATASCRSAQELVASVNILWRNGRFLAASLSVRLLIELWGMLAYADRKIIGGLDEGKPEVFDKALERLGRLILASKANVPLPTHKQMDLTGMNLDVINVMDFVRSTSAEDMYAFLCDACHPSYFQHSYLVLAGAQYDNWSNERFGERAHTILERTATAAEVAVAGIVKSTEDIFAKCLPRILAESTRS